MRHRNSGSKKTVICYACNLEKLYIVVRISYIERPYIVVNILNIVFYLMSAKYDLLYTIYENYCFHSPAGICRSICSTW